MRFGKIRASAAPFHTVAGIDFPDVLLREGALGEIHVESCLTACGHGRSPRGQGGLAAAIRMMKTGTS